MFDLDSMEISEEIEQPAKGGSRKSMALQLASQFIQGQEGLKEMMGPGLVTVKFEVSFQVLRKT